MAGKILAVVIVIAYVALLYFIVFGRKKKERKRLDEINRKLHPGVKIVTISGICCTVDECLNERELIVELSAAEDKHIRAKLLRGAVRDIVE